MKKNRQSIRLKNYDYSQSGMYYITICTQNRECLFGNIVDGKMKLNAAGEIIDSVWQSLPHHHPVKLDAFQIMPNHVHFVLTILSSPRRGVGRNAPTIGNAPTTFGNVTAGSLPCVIRAFKSECTKQIHIGLPNIPVWQRNYYEHIIRTKTALNKIKKYIQTNPQMWDQDQNNPLIPII